MLPPKICKLHTASLCHHGGFFWWLCTDYKLEGLPLSFKQGSHAMITWKKSSFDQSDYGTVFHLNSVYFKQAQKPQLFNIDLKPFLSRFTKNHKILYRNLSKKKVALFNPGKNTPTLELFAYTVSLRVVNPFSIFTSERLCLSCKPVLYPSYKTSI